MFTTYVLKNTETGRIYIGQTQNIERRLERHNGLLANKKSGYTYKNKGTGKWELAYQESYETRAEAMRREKELKTARGRLFLKEKLV